MKVQDLAQVSVHETTQEIMLVDLPPAHPSDDRFGLIVPRKDRKLLGNDPQPYDVALPCERHFQTEASHKHNGVVRLSLPGQRFIQRKEDFIAKTAVRYVAGYNAPCVVQWFDSSTGQWQIDYIKPSTRLTKPQQQDPKDSRRRACARKAKNRPARRGRH